MAAITDRYSVLPNQHRTSSGRPGALLKAVILRHKDSAGGRSRSQGGGYYYQQQQEQYQDQNPSQFQGAFSGVQAQDTQQQRQSQRQSVQVTESSFRRDESSNQSEGEPRPGLGANTAAATAAATTAAAGASRGTRTTTTQPTLTAAAAAAQPPTCYPNPIAITTTPPAATTTGTAATTTNTATVNITGLAPPEHPYSFKYNHLHTNTPLPLPPPPPPGPLPSSQTGHHSGPGPFSTATATTAAVTVWTSPSWSSSSSTSTLSLPQNSSLEALKHSTSTSTSTTGSSSPSISKSNNTTNCRPALHFLRHARSTSSPLLGSTPPLLASPPSITLCPAALQQQHLQHHQHHLCHNSNNINHQKFENRHSSRLSLPIATMPEYRHIRSGSLSIPNGSHNTSHSMPRSPPNTSHVPCKFYRQGACQAGNACPFSHDLGAAAENICKYFAKGNCKFGPKCANIHVLPDGRRINYGKNGVTIGPTPINLANRSAASHGSTNSTAVNGPYNQSTASALTSSLYRTDQSTYPYDENNHHLGRQPSLDNGLPTIDTPYSHPNSNYGSPREEDSTRLGFGLSPANGGKGLSVLDAPLPASFDSNGISNAARYPAAPWPSSVPSKFGLESPSPSLSSVKDSRTSETLKLLHTSAFGSSEHLATPTAGSPPNSHHLNGDEYFGKRAMHSSRYTKPRLLSASVPKSISVDRDWEPEFAFDDDNVPENLVPGDLQELLTPLEKARRGSMRAEQPDVSIESMNKYGSPIGTSPSRWGPLFQRQKEEEEMSRAARSAAGSAFGHVGSPLRNSILAQEANNEFRNSNGLHRPSTIRPGSDTMSALSQQLQRSHLNDAFGNSSPLLHPTTNRTSNNIIAPIGKDRVMERHVSTGSISSSVTGRFTTPIDEEDPAFVFSMEEEDDSSVSRIRKRGSTGLTIGYSYAGVVASKAVTNGSKEGRDAVSVSGR